MNNHSRLMKGSMICTFVFVLILGYCTFQIYERFNAFDNRITNLEQRIDERSQAERDLTKELNKISKQNEELKYLEQQRIEKQKNHARAISMVKENGISVDDDLGKTYSLALDEDDMNRIIDSWLDHIRKDTILRGHGEAFITASRETGLDPVYLLAHAILESGSGTSYYATTRYNFFGINAVDNNPDLASTMGDDVDQGIISGAKWIKSNFYSNGYKTLDSMYNAGYATGKNWDIGIQDIYNDLVKFL